MTTDSETVEQYLNFVQIRFLISVLVFVSRDYELGRVSDFGGVDRQSRTGLIFIHNSFTTKLRKKFAIKRSLKILPHLKCITYLVKYVCQKIRNNLKHGYCLTINGFCF